MNATTATAVGGMNDSRAKDVMRRHDRMKSARSNFERMWQEIAERILPRAAEFTGQKTPGEKRTERQFDSTAPLALERFAAAMHSLLTPSTQQWHKLRVPDDELNKSRDVKIYLDEVTNFLFRARYRTDANFASQMTEVYMSLGAFGTGVLFVDEWPGYGLMYKAIHLAEMYLAENAAGRIDTAHREYQYTARQCVQAFGMEALTEKMRGALERQSDDLFTIVHCVYPNEERKNGRMDYRGWPIASLHVAAEGNTVLRESGYRTMPYAVSRYTTSPREIYGRGPASTVLPDIKMVNEMEKTTIRAGHRAVDPPMLLQSDGALSSFQNTPGALNWGGIDDQGRQVAQPMDTRANLPWALEMTEAKRKVINDAFLITLFQILVETPQITATEALLRAQEKGALLAPTMGRQQNELLGPTIERELDVLGRAGQLPQDVPEAMQEAGGHVDIEYTSPLARLQRADEGVAILRSIEAMAPLAQINPQAMRRINADKALQKLWEINGAPADVLYSDDDLAAMDAKDQQQLDMAKVLEAAPVAANAAKSLAQAQQIAAQAPTGLPQQAVQ
jgi:hypothetical protein